MKSFFPLFAAFLGGLILASISGYFVFSRPDSASLSRETVRPDGHQARPVHSSPGQAPSRPASFSPPYTQKQNVSVSRSATSSSVVAPSAGSQSSGFVSSTDFSSASRSESRGSIAVPQSDQTSAAQNYLTPNPVLAEGNFTLNSQAGSVGNVAASSFAGSASEESNVALPNHVDNLDPADQAELPASLVPNSPEVSITTDQQVAEWEKLQDDFIEQVGEGAPEPQNEASRARWASAQEYNDWLFRAKFGTYAYLAQKAAGIQEQPAH